MVGASARSTREIRQEALDELRRINKYGFAGIKVSIDIDSLLEKIPPEPCDCFECWKIRNNFI